MVTSYVEGGIRLGTDWRNGLDKIIEIRLNRKPAQPQRSEQPPQPWLNLPCGCTIEKDDKMNSSVFWNEFNRVVQCHKCGQLYEPVPPAQHEWTVKTVTEIANLKYPVGIALSSCFKRIADAHNAALAEREQLKNCRIVSNSLARALDAERERRDHWQGVAEAHDCRDLTDAFVQLTREREQLDTEREKTNNWSKVAEMFRIQLLAAQAAIEKHNFTHRDRGCYVIDVDPSALREHDAEVRKPLVEALELLQTRVETRGCQLIIERALAQTTISAPTSGAASSDPQWPDVIGSGGQAPSEASSEKQEWYVDEEGDIVTIRTKELTRIFVFPKGTNRRLPEAICAMRKAEHAALEQSSGAASSEPQQELSPESIKAWYEICEYYKLGNLSIAGAKIINAALAAERERTAAFRSLWHSGTNKPLANAARCFMEQQNGATKKALQAALSQVKEEQ
jgi:hypothetical protein